MPLYQVVRLNDAEAVVGEASHGLLPLALDGGARRRAGLGAVGAALRRRDDLRRQIGARGEDSRHDRETCVLVVHVQPLRCVRAVLLGRLDGAAVVGGVLECVDRRHRLNQQRWPVLRGLPQQGQLAVLVLVVGRRGILSSLRQLTLRHIAQVLVGDAHVLDSVEVAEHPLHLPLDRADVRGVLVGR